MLKNRDEVVEKLSQIIRDLDVERNRFPVDVYLYVDEDGNGTLDTFPNPGGNSWRDDGHFTIYTEEEHFGGEGEIIGEYELGALAEVLEMSEEELAHHAACYYGCDDEEVDEDDIRRYIEDREELLQKVVDDWREYIAHETYYYDAAEEAVNKYEKHVDMLEDIHKLEEAWKKSLEF